MKRIFAIICIVFSVQAFAQTTEEAMQMVKSNLYSEVDTSLLLQNNWQPVYEYKIDSGTLEKINSATILHFEGKDYFLTNLQYPQQSTSGLYFLSDDYLSLNTGFVKSKSYNIITCFSNEYLLLEELLTKKEQKKGKEQKRYLYKRISPLFSRLPNEKEAFEMLKKEPDTISDFSKMDLEGKWSLIYGCCDVPEKYYLIDKVSYTNTQQFNTGEEIPFKILNMFQNKYIVAEKECIKETKKKTIKWKSRLLYIKTL